MLLQGTPGIVLGSMIAGEDRLTPGPGSYEVAKINTIENAIRKKGAKNSSMFVSRDASSDKYVICVSLNI